MCMMGVEWDFMCVCVEVSPYVHSYEGVDVYDGC